jgi:single-strand DNA-binding protein
MLNNSGINKVFLVGHIGKEPRMHRGNDQQEAMCFPMVTNEFIKKDKETIEHIEWHQVKIPDRVLNESALKLEKGQLIYVEGKIHTRSFMDEMNVKRYKAEIIANKVSLLSSVTAKELVL